jgi:mannose-6-phosphate isomerase
MSERVFRLNPQFYPKIWGGRIFQHWYSQSNQDLRIGEVWAVSTLPEGESEIQDKNSGLKSFLLAHPSRFPMRSEDLPFRVTLIDAQDDLSIQVHPTDHYAQLKNLSTGLSEAWVVLNAQQGSRIEIGHRARTKAELLTWIETNQWDQLLEYHEVQTSDIIFIPAGTIHAIGHGLLIYEISQRIDVTYRLYDYHRVDVKTGAPRQLHLNDALQVLAVPNTADFSSLCQHYSENNGEVQVVLEKEGLFGLAIINPKSSVLYLNHWGFLTITQGKGSIDGINISQGDTVLISQSNQGLMINGAFTGIYAYCV